LKTASAVAEFAIWVNFRLHASHLDLQYAHDRLRSQRPHPQWAANALRNDAQPFCAALARACRRARLGRDTCARCLPRVDSSSRASALRAIELPDNSATCVAPPPEDSGVRLRGLTLTECTAYARHRSLEFIGVQHELAEFAGCVVWNGRTIEFNDHSRSVGCNVRANHGVCLCVPLTVNDAK